MSRYFHISHGLRGCYMPDSVCAVRVDTRRELKAILESEADSLRSSGYVGLSKKTITAMAASLWKRSARSFGDTVAPCRQAGQREFSYGLFGSPATRADWLEYESANQ